MADMNEKDIVRGFEEIAGFELSEKKVEKDLGEIREVLRGRAGEVHGGRRRTLRTLARSRWGRMCAVAAIVVIVLSVGSRFFPGSQLEAAELLGKVADNMERLAWFKSITKSYVPGKEEPVSTDVHWIDVENTLVYAMYSDKYVHLMDYEAWRWSIYNPDVNNMTVKPLHGEWISPAGQIHEYIDKLANEGVKVRQSEGAYRGKKAIVLQFDESLNYISANGPATNMLMGGKSVKTIRSRLTIDSEYLLGASEVTYLDNEGAVIAVKKSESQAVETGPADIYELGVPRDVKVVNKVPDEKVKEIREKIEEKHGLFLDEYIAVITEARMERESERFYEAQVVFAKGKKLRVDVYGALYGNPDNVTGQYRSELAESLELLEPYWPGKDSRGIRSVRLYDGLWQYVLDAREGKLTAWEKQRRPDGDMYGDDDVDDHARKKLWWLGEPEHMFEDEYSRENGLVAMELTVQAAGSQLPKRFVLYVDPEKDCLCHRYVTEELFEAPWQEDKNWLDSVANKEILEEEVRIREVVEYGRTSAGLWYPRVITEKGYSRDYGQHKRDDDSIIRIHLIAEHPEFPEGIFDPDKLPQVAQ